MTIESPANHVILQINTPYRSQLSNAIRMVNIDPSTTINEADFATIVGTVVAVPKILCKRHDYKGYSTKDIKVGDKAIFSYLVVHAFDENPELGASFTNEFRVGNKFYWKCEIHHLFAIVRDGEIRMQNDYVMIEEVKQPSIIKLVSEKKQVENAEISKVIAIRPEMYVHPESSVAVNFKKCQTYQLDDNFRFSIVKRKDILAVVHNI